MAALGTKVRAWTAEEDKFLRDNCARLTSAQIGDEIGRTKHAVDNRLGVLKITGNRVATEPVPSANRPLSEVVASLTDTYRRKAAHHGAKREGIDIQLPDDGPFAVFCFGDPHIDDPGTDAGQVFYHMELCRDTPGCYGANVGDMSNNWVGSLARLYAHQNVTDDEANELVSYVLDFLPWALVVEGNHDRWSTVLGLLCKQKGITRVAHGGRFRFKAGETSMTLDMRHDHKGRSQYNPAFGQAKQSYRGNDAHVIVGGHTHQGAYTQLRNGVTGRVNHCIRLGSYKKEDDFAESLHLDRDDLGPACVVVCDTRLPEDHVGFVKCFFDVEAGCAYLGQLRAEWAKEEVA